jgi:hypothetical protein
MITPPACWAPEVKAEKRKSNRPESHPSFGLNPRIRQDMKKWFADYLRTFKSDDADLRQNISLKQEHSQRVCTEILDIGGKIGLHDQELALAELIALFHDIGRFEQYARYRTFADRASVNHAAFGVKILKEKRVLDKLDESTRDLVLKTILYHNRATLPRQESKTCLLFTKLLRDADKLDIWRVVTEYYARSDSQRNAALELGLPDTPEISAKVYRDLLAGKIVSIHHLKNLNDFKLLQISWIYDINFVPTFQRIRERAYLAIIRQALPQSDKIETIFSVILDYVETRERGNR